MKFARRKSAPRVVDGKVQRKNRAAESPSYYNTPQDIPVLDRRRPGPGYRHLIRKKHLVGFISILPDWAELSQGLRVVVLAPGEDNTAGWYDQDVVAICAWNRELWLEYERSFYLEHRDVFQRLEVPVEKKGRYYLGKWTESTARAYQLLHILLHELGHHHDRMTTKSKRRSARGEGYAEEYALKYEKVIWHRYFEVFGFD